MKKLQLILCLVMGIFLLTNCDDKDKEEITKLTFQDLPVPAQEFLTTYFPDNKIVNISLEKQKETDDLRSSDRDNKTVTELLLYVTLQDNIIVTLSPRDGTWRYIDAPNGLPDSAIELMYHYPKLRLKEPQAKVIFLSSLYWRTIVITLDNGHKYAETERFTYGGSILAEVGISDQQVAAKLSEFGKRNQLDSAFARGLWFKLTEEEGVVYRFFIGDVLILTFNDKGDWIHGQIESYEYILPSGLVALLTKISGNELPESIGEVVRGVWDKGAIEIISCYGNGYYGFKFKEVDLLVNEKSGMMTPPLEMTNKLVSDYFEIPYKLVTNPVYRVYVGPYEYRYTYIYQSDADFLRAERDMYNNLAQIEAYHVEKDKPRLRSLPPKMLTDILPASITDYMNENYKDQGVYRMRFAKGYGYNLYIDQYYLTFTEEGHFRSKGGWWTEKL